MWFLPQHLRCRNIFVWNKNYKRRESVWWHGWSERLVHSDVAFRPKDCEFVACCWCPRRGTKYKSCVKLSNFAVRRSEPDTFCWEIQLSMKKKYVKISTRIRDFNQTRLAVKGNKCEFKRALLMRGYNLWIIGKKWRLSISVNQVRPYGLGTENGRGETKWWLQSMF